MNVAKICNMSIPFTEDTEMCYNKDGYRVENQSTNIIPYGSNVPNCINVQLPADLSGISDDSNSKHGEIIACR